MRDMEVALAAVTSILLFIYGLEHFSKEVQRITGESFRKILARLTQYRVVGLLLGAILTAVIQSSSATSVIAISLVNAGVLSFQNSLGIILGANVGTTLTAQLVAFKLTAFAPYLIIGGFFLSWIRSKYAVFAKSLFYFGFVFFSLNLISSSLAPLQNDPRLTELLMHPQNPFYAILLGVLFTAVVQSSSVTTGLAIVFVQQSLISFENATFLLMGANVGTTITAFFAALNTDLAAKKTALAHFVFNLGGVVLFFPLLYFSNAWLRSLAVEPAFALANFHLLFNAVSALVFLLLLGPFAKGIDHLLGEGSMDFPRADLSEFRADQDFVRVREALASNLRWSYEFIQESYNLVTLSIETHYEKIGEAASKRIEYFRHIQSEILNFFSDFIGHSSESEKVEELLSWMNRYEYLLQIHDSIEDIAAIKKRLDESYIELQSDVLIVVRSIASETLSLFENVAAAQTGDSEAGTSLQRRWREFDRDLGEHHKNLLALMARPDRKDAGAIFHLITYSKRLRDKLRHYASLQGL